MKNVLVIIAIMLLAGFGQASTITVCPKGCNYPSIQEAVYSAKPNDTIALGGGNYNESIFLTKELKFVVNDNSNGTPVITGGLYTQGYRYSVRGFGFNSVQSSPDLSTENPGTKYYWIGVARQYYSAKSYFKALEAISNALNTDSRLVYALNLEGLILDAQGRADEAMECYDRALKIDQSYDALWVNKGADLSTIEHYEQALACFDNATKANPRDDANWAWKSNCLSNLARYDDALMAINKAIELNPQSSNNWANKANVLLQLGKKNEALTTVDKAIDLSPSAVGLWDQKGSILQTIGGRNADADAAFAKSRELNGIP